MQESAAYPVDGYIDISASNASQQRGAHGLFRYFGKLAPDVTGRVLDLSHDAVDATLGRTPNVVDLMCGSGTTLVEAANRGWLATGVDVNPVAVLYSRVKTESVDTEIVEVLTSEMMQFLETDGPPSISASRQTANASRWFDATVLETIFRLFAWLDIQSDSSETRLIRAVILSRLRHYSNASARTGRIFYDPTSSISIHSDLPGRIRSASAVVPKDNMEVEVQESDARRTQLSDGSADIAFLHPPYFALYRYSSDVLRFELDIGGYNRKEINKGEIAEGWKSGDPGNLIKHVQDMGDVFSEARRILQPAGILALTTSNSTLGDNQMPVIDSLIEEALNRGLTVVKHFERKAHFGSASYHRSARTDKVIQRDHVILLRPAR